MPVRGNAVPFEGLSLDGTGDDGELLLSREIVADVVVVDGPVLAALGVLDEHRDSDRSTGARSEDLAALFARLLALRALVATQIEHVDRAELVHQRLPEPVHRLPVEPSAVGNEAHYAAIADAVGRPAEGADVRVVEPLL